MREAPLTQHFGNTCSGCGITWERDGFDDNEYIIWYCDICRESASSIADLNEFVRRPGYMPLPIRGSTQKTEPMPPPIQVFNPCIVTEPASSTRSGKRAKSKSVVTIKSESEDDRRGHETMDAPDSDDDIQLNLEAEKEKWRVEKGKIVDKHLPARSDSLQTEDLIVVEREDGSELIELDEGGIFEDGQSSPYGEVVDLADCIVIDDNVVGLESLRHGERECKSPSKKAKKKSKKQVDSATKEVDRHTEMSPELSTATILASTVRSIVPPADETVSANTKPSKKRHGRTESLLAATEANSGHTVKRQKSTIALLDHSQSPASQEWPKLISEEEFRALKLLQQQQKLNQYIDDTANYLDVLQPRSVPMATYSSLATLVKVHFDGMSTGVRRLNKRQTSTANVMAELEKSLEETQRCQVRASQLLKKMQKRNPFKNMDADEQTSEQPEEASASVPS